MATAYIYFGKPLNPDTATSFVMAMRTLIADKNADGTPAWSDFLISMSSNGGDVAPAFAIYNELLALSVNVHTHNVGAIDSAAIVPFMAGGRRTATATSAFFFHPLHWTFATLSPPKHAVSEASKWLDTYEAMMAGIVASRSGIPQEDVLKMMREGRSLTADEAKKLGLIHEIENHKIPLLARSYQA